MVEFWVQPQNIKPYVKNTCPVKLKVKMQIPKFIIFGILAWTAKEVNMDPETLITSMTTMW